MRAFNRWLIDECKTVLNCGVPDRKLDGNDGRDDAGCSSSPSPSPFLHYRWHSHNHLHHLDCPPFVLNPSIKIYLYATCAPCGDASMQLTMSEQADPTPWTCALDSVAQTSTATSVTSTVPFTPDHPSPSPWHSFTSPASVPVPATLPGRGYFSRLAVTRRKPSRPDAAPTLSKSCSDKLALKQVTSVLSTAVAAWLVRPTRAAYLSALVMPSEEIEGCEGGCERAFATRLERTERWNRLSGGKKTQRTMGLYRFTLCGVSRGLTESLWDFAKPRPKAMANSGDPGNQDEKKEKSAVVRAGNVSALWIAGHHPVFRDTGDNITTARAISQGEIKEVLINGVKQGFRFDSTNQKKASSISRSEMWVALCGAIREAEAVSASISASCNQDQDQDDGATLTRGFFAATTYASLKQSASLTGSGRERLEATKQGRQVLGDWAENRGDEEWEGYSL